MTLTQDIRIEGVGKDFHSKGSLFTALENVGITLPIGGFTTLIGPSGCGKSTLLRVVSDILDPDRGSVELFGMTPSEARKDGAFGFVFQDPVLLPWRSAVRNVELPLEAAGVPKKERRERALEMLRLVGLDGFEENLPAKLSGGMARRVAIARALVMSPRILFLDEPFAGLDEFRRREMNEELQRIWSGSDTTAILVTHNVGEAVFMSDQIVVMGRNPGRVIAQRTIELERPRTLEMTRSPEYIAYEEEITELLRAAYRGAED